MVDESEADIPPVIEEETHPDTDEVVLYTPTEEDDKEEVTTPSTKEEEVVPPVVEDKPIEKEEINDNTSVVEPEETNNGFVDIIKFLVNTIFKFIKSIFKF